MHSFAAQIYVQSGIIGFVLAVKVVLFDLSICQIRLLYLQKIVSSL